MSDHRITTSSVFAPATRHTLDLIAEHNRAQRCTFLVASNFVNPTAAKLAYLLGELVGPGPRFTYLVSSGLEALSGAINLARHTAVRAGADDGGWILLVDPGERYREYLDPLDTGPEGALIPHVVTVSSASEATHELSGHRWAAVVLVDDPAGGDTPDDGSAGDIDSRDTDSRDTDSRERTGPDPELADIAAAVRLSGGLVVWCGTERDLGDPAFFADPYDADVVVFGENLAERQVPFGAFTMTRDAHAVWLNDTDCFAHTSTFGGNTLCAALVLDALDRHGHVDPAHREVLTAIDADPEVAIEYWGRCIKPNIAALARTFGLHIPIVRAEGGRFTTAEGRDVIDCAGGVGSNLRGHNPPDLTTEVLARHDPEHDHVADLAAVLAELTGLTQMFPAVSGAVANDMAVTLAVLARPHRRTVITFQGNFAGKSLFSINLSRHGPQRTESDDDAFRPYYQHVVYLDPFAPDAVDRFTAAVRDGDVALVWFELVQGAACRPLPTELVRAVDRLRAEHGYLVGVDEVLSGGWRSADSYLAHDGILTRADVVTVGKTLSDMTVPMAAVLVSDDVAARAAATAPHRVARLRARYRNQLGAHVAVHALRAVSADPQARAAQQQAYADLVAELDALFGRSRVFGAVAGSAAHLRLTLARRWFPSRGPLVGLLEFTLADLVYRRCQVFLPVLRMLHRVAADPADLAELKRRLELGTPGITPLTVYRYAIGSVLRSRLPRLSALLIGRAARSRV